jgi:hypothetical protein
VKMKKVDAVELEFATEKKERKLLKARKDIKSATEKEKPTGGIVAEWVGNRKLN